MEKVKVTPETAEVIENSLRKYPRHHIVRNYNSIGFKFREEMDLDTLIRALYIGYEIEAEFKVGDWVKDTSTGSVFQIINMQHRNNINDKRYTTKRLATPEEIQQEKERRWWAKIGRDFFEFRVGDIVYDDNKKAMEVVDIKGDYLHFKGFSPCNMCFCTLICPAEKRFDINA